MKTDAEIEAERLHLGPLIGPTRAGWYAEACKIEYADLTGASLWSCRYREMAREAGSLRERLAESERRVAELETGLQPFAVNVHSVYGNDDVVGWPNMKAGYFRTASHLLSPPDSPTTKPKE